MFFHELHPSRGAQHEGFFMALIVWMEWTLRSSWLVTVLLSFCFSKLLFVLASVTQWSEPSHFIQRDLLDVAILWLWIFSCFLSWRSWRSWNWGLSKHHGLADNRNSMLKNRMKDTMWTKFTTIHTYKIGEKWGDNDPLIAWRREEISQNWVEWWERIRKWIG